MAGGSHFIWIPFLLSCVFQASDNRHVHQDVNSLISPTGNSEVESILSKIPITIPEGIDPKNINVTLVSIRTCADLKEQLTLLNRQLQQTTLHNSHLENEAFGLRRESRLLKQQLASCSSTASAITGSYQTQLHNKMKQLLETFDSDTFLILKTIALTREVSTLQKKVKHAANSTETTIEIQVLKRELQEKINELNAKTQEIERSHTNSLLILQIISLQNQIWDLEQAISRRGEASLQPDKGILALQGQLDKKLSELRGKGDADSVMLELISVHSKIAVMRRLIRVHIEESRTNTADYQRQWRQKAELLKKKILQLNRDENNTELTKEILKLQAEVENLRQLMINAKITTDSQLTELRLILEREKKQQEILEKQLEEAEYVQAQLIMKIISIMKEVRELQVDEQDQTTSTSQATTLQTLLQAKEIEYAKAQDEINELRRKLQLKSQQCSGLEGRYEHVNTEFEQKILELNRTGDFKSALILNVMKLYDELKTLRDQISTTEDPERISELQRQLEEKQDELNFMTDDIERLIANPKRILTIIELQNDMWDLETKAANDTTGDYVKELQNRVDGLISEIDDKGDKKTKLMLKIITLQSQVEQLQSQLSDIQMLRPTHITQLRNDLTTKRNELQKYVNELNEKNQTDTRLILTVTDLRNQLRNLERERNNNNNIKSSLTKLREQLKASMAQHSRDQAELRELQSKLQLKSQQCSGLEERYEHLKTEFEQKIVELNRTGDSKSALILNVINLHDELKTLRDRITTTEDPERISELRRQVEGKQDELNTRTADIERLIANPKIVLTIIELQNEIWDLEKKAANSGRVKELENRVDDLISQIEDEGGENTKLMLKILMLQSQVEQLQKRLSDVNTLQTSQVTELANDFTTKKRELQKYVSELNEKDLANAKLILTVTDLHNQLKNLDKLKNEGQAATATITKLKEQLKAKVEEHAQDQAKIKDLQNQLTQTEAQCSSFDQTLKDLQNDLDSKMKELQNKSDTVTTLALQVSTLTLQLEELKRQLQNTESESKIKELQKIIDEKTNELAKKTAELNARSAQPQRFLQIIAIQTEIERFSNLARNDTDYEKIRGLQNHLNYLISGIQDENSENTKLMFKILAEQDEIAKLKRQQVKQTQEKLKEIKDLENELEDVRNQIKEKTLVLHTSDLTIANLSAQIMELHKKIKPLEEAISIIKEENAENLEEIQKRLDLTKRQLQDSEHLLKEADANNFKSIMEISDLRAKLKKAQKLASRASGKDISELEQQIQTLKKENRNLENTNIDLKQEVQELKMCCSDVNTHCDDLQRQLQQSHEDADRLQQQLLEKDGKLDQLQQELEKQTREYNKLQDDYINLQNKVADVEDNTIFARKMTLDPNTANPRIVLSADNTEMSTAETIQNIPDNPGRFDVALGVLGSTGFSSGRHYWEVSVAGKLCYHLGMASESAERKGSITFRPTNGFWTIVLNKQGQYKAIDKRSVIIPVETQPLTLGILLDYKKGQVSFYDAGARSHMYSFVGQTFTDKIYPFINFCVEDIESSTPIVLLSPGSVDWIK
ncbi:golgin subfamily A member 4 isoform X1 [Micropterus dolomieu]|uniref:golgin subfamily A member 4 isoform X1 n=2 Tax=Micropterus dolomieu TaxID=147949 RepID=UPI001E8EC79B|nr:golgin subfamily A member 4 isoform X1 [Micropterus dolomieu]